MIYTIIDIETTGQGNKITEIAIFKHDGEQIIDEFTSLVNPEAEIPSFITALTGIDNAMVARAPRFSEIAKQVLEITEGCTFVAHNVNFDYNIIRNEFKLLDVDFTRRKLCTVRLSRKLIPGHASYSLGKLCKALEIHVVDRHRARGDAEATVILFERLLAQDNAEDIFKEFLKKSSKEATLPPHLPTAVFNAIPQAAGIYYFKNKKGKVIYVGKAKDLKKRVLSHFYSKTVKALNLCRETADIDFELSGSELIALLMEDAAIKKHYPEYNQASKRAKKSFGIFSYQDQLGISHLAYNNLKGCPNPLQIFHSIQDCRHFLEQLCAQFELCPRYCHLQDGVQSCSHYKIKSCHGICKKEEAVNIYNLRVSKAIQALDNSKTDMLLKERGRDNDESAFILIESGRYVGYGFIAHSEQITDLAQVQAYLIPQQDNRDIQNILRARVQAEKPLKTLV